MQKISIIVPTWNEEGNVQKLVERIHKALSAKEIGYEIIVVDDHSTDKTAKIIKSLEEHYPVKLYSKQGKQGKAQSLLEGFTHATNDIFCMIDADLQYPPEAIIEMLQKIEKGAAIVIANRTITHTPLIRRFLSRGFMYFFGKLLHGFDFDVQSGLKVFKKECLEGLELNPSPWAFDMEFLRKNVDLGYKVTSVNILFEKRVSGKAKIDLFKASWEIGFHAIKLKFSSNKIIHHVAALSFRKSA